MVTKKKSTKKKAPARKRKSARARLTPRKDKRGLAATDIVLATEAPEVAQLVTEVSAVGGAAIGASGTPNVVQPWSFSNNKAVW